MDSMISTSGREADRSRGLAVGEIGALPVPLVPDGKPARFREEELARLLDLTIQGRDVRLLHKIRPKRLRRR